MKLRQIFQILLISFVFGLMITGCDKKDDEPTPPSTEDNQPGESDDKPGNTDDDPTPDVPEDTRPEWKKVKCINQPVIVNGKTMYNHFPDLSRKSSWWQEFDEYWWNVEAQYILSGQASFINYYENTKYHTVEIKIDTDTDKEFFFKNGDIRIFFSLYSEFYDIKGQLIDFSTLNENDKIIIKDLLAGGIFGERKPYVDFEDSTGTFHPYEEYGCEITDAEIYFKSYDPVDGIVTLWFKNMELTGEYDNGKTHEKEPRHHIINGEISFVYYVYK